MPKHQPLSTYRASAIAIAIATAAGAGTAVPSIAQDGQRATGLEEIVVTAQRREESLQDTPIAITAFTADKLGDLGVFDVSQVAGFAPNVNMMKQPSSNSNMGIAIRGIGVGETHLTADPKVGLYIDGIFISKTVGAVFDIAELERIEVLRGPQGTLFGRNTTGGAINVTTRKPTGELGGKADTSVGNFGYLRYGGSLDLPAMGGFAAKLSFNHMETDGWAYNHYTGVAQPPQTPTEKVEKDLGSEDNDSYRIALRWTPREDLTLDYAFDKTDNSGVATPFQILKVKDYLNNGFTKNPVDFQMLGGSLYKRMAQNVKKKSHREQDFVLDEMTEEYLKIEGRSFVAAWEATDNVTLKYLFGTRDSEHNNGADLDGGTYFARDLFYGVFAGNNGKVQTPGFHSRIDDGSVEMDSHEFQIIGSAFDDRLHYTGGVFMYEEDVYEHNPQTFSLPIAFVAAQGAFTPGLGALYDAAGFCPAAYYGYLCVGTQRLPIPGAGDPYVPGVVDFAYGQNTESQAIYGQATYSFTDQLDLTLGLRYTEDEKKAFLYNQNMVRNIPTHSQTNPVRGKDDWNNVSYLANLNYAFTDGISAYVTYTTGYNGGGFNTRAATQATFQVPYDEEEVESFELGLKSELFDNRMRVNFAMFHYDYSDIQINQFQAGSGGASAHTVNAGAATMEGIEFDMVAVPVDGLTIDLTYGYLDARFDKFMDRNPVTDQINDISGTATMKYAPENTASLGVQYDFEPFSFGALSARLDVNYRDSVVFHTHQNQWDSANDRTLVNGRLSLNDIKLGSGSGSDKGSLRVSLWGKNLTDEEYINWGIDFGSIGFAGATYGEPRTYGLDVIYTYE
ncbi:MAG: Vitamin B12 transporter BtuB [Pseudomonadales bacterium]|nr:Vitamin B12 transporter BtuB [Pseudomonadales bacterium]